MKTIIEELKEIKYNCGDVRDREGNYISDQLSEVIDKLKALVK